MRATARHHFEDFPSSFTPSLPSRPCRGFGMSLLGFEPMLLSCQSRSCYLKESRHNVWQRWVRRGLLALSVVLACFLAYLLVTNSTTVPPPTATVPGSMDTADATISQFTFTQTKGDEFNGRCRRKRLGFLSGTSGRCSKSLQSRYSASTGRN